MSRSVLVLHKNNVLLFMMFMKNITELRLAFEMLPHSDLELWLFHANIHLNTNTKLSVFWLPYTGSSKYILQSVIFNGDNLLILPGLGYFWLKLCVGISTIGITGICLLVAPGYAETIHFVESNIWNRFKTLFKDINIFKWIDTLSHTQTVVVLHSIMQ